jgi:hypothetical protein
MSIAKTRKQLDIMLSNLNAVGLYVAANQLCSRVNELEAALRRLAGVLNGNIPNDDPEFPVNGAIHALAEAHAVLAKAEES